MYSLLEDTKQFRTNCVTIYCKAERITSMKYVYLSSILHLNQLFLKNLVSQQVDATGDTHKYMTVTMIIKSKG